MSFAASPRFRRSYIAPRAEDAVEATVLSAQEEAIKRRKIGISLGKWGRV
jgi:hypothetical protein